MHGKINELRKFYAQEFNIMVKQVQNQYLDIDCKLYLAVALYMGTFFNSKNNHTIDYM